MSVTFTSTALGAVAGALTLTDNAVGSPQSVTLTGTGVIPFARLSAASINFGNQVLGARAPPATITMTNVGLGNLLVTTEAIGGVNAGDFATTADTFTGAILPSYASCSVGVTFTPSAMGKRAGTLTFTENASNSPQTVALSGTV